jgi:CHAT domain-containing protein
VLKNDPNSIKSYWSTDLINLMLNLAGLYRDLGLARNEIPLLRTSVRYYDAVTSLIDSVRSGLQLQSSQMELSRRQERSFDEMVELGYQLFQMTREEQDLSAMFEFIELSKSAGLWSSIRETEKKKRILTEEDRLREQDLNHQIADIQSLINEQLTLENPNQARLKELQGLNFTLNRKKDSLVRIFTDKYPELKNAASGPVLISLKEARNLLAKDEAMLQFSYSTGTIYCIALTSGRQEVISIQIDSAIRENIRFIVNFMKGGYSSFNGRERQEFNRSASHLYGKLIAPFEKIITGKNLIIIPDGPLNLVPFEALIMPDDGKSSGNYITNNYLIRRYTVSYALSATLFNYKPLVSIQPGKAILAVAPVYDPVKIEHSELLRSRSEELPQLKGTLEEARSAYKLLSGKLLTGTKAKESTFKSICQDYAVIHLAMHTVTDPKDPMNTFLVFTPEADRKEDGLLFSREVYNLNLGASLVVLSACETGSGEMAAGEGIISLGRGFMFAGCPNMVITLWRVDDESGKHIMKMFYQNLQEGQAISTALRNSKLMYIESADEVHAHPHFWAAFSAMGPDIPVELGQKDSSPWHLFVIPFLLLAGVLILVQKRKSPPGDGDMVETD